MTRMNFAMSMRLEANAAFVCSMSSKLRHLRRELPGAVQLILARVPDVDHDEGPALAVVGSENRSALIFQRFRHGLHLLAGASAGRAEQGDLPAREVVGGDEL